MLPYYLLILFVFFWNYISKNTGDERHSRKFFMNGVFWVLYVFCVIRSFDVGRDVLGYVQEYNLASSMSWNNWKMAHFEVGYIFLMKVCNLIGLSARGFFCVVYLIILWPVCHLIKFESPRPLISVIIFIGFQFFVFDLSGLRQAMAMSLCMVAFIVAQRDGRENLIKFILLVVCASLLHKSAICFLLAYFIIRLPLNKTTIVFFCIAAGLCMAINQLGVALLLDYYGNTHYSYSTEDSQQLGLILVFIVLFAVLGVCLYQSSQPETHRKIIASSTLLVMTGVCALCLVNGSILLRASMYFYFPIIILPSFLTQKSIGNLGDIIKVALIIVVLINFFANEINSLDVTPYEIASDLSLTK